MKGRSRHWVLNTHWEMALSDRTRIRKGGGVRRWHRSDYSWKFQRQEIGVKGDWQYLRSFRFIPRLFALSHKQIPLLGLFCFFCLSWWPVSTYLGIHMGLYSYLQTHSLPCIVFRGNESHQMVAPSNHSWKLIHIHTGPRVADYLSFFPCHLMTIKWTWQHFPLNNSSVYNSSGLVCFHYCITMTIIRFQNFSASQRESYAQEELSIPHLPLVNHNLCGFLCSRHFMQTDTHNVFLLCVEFFTGTHVSGCLLLGAK